MPSESTAYCLRRNETSVDILLASVRQLFNEQSLFDCSIVCEGKVIKGHKFLLSAASQYFKAAFTSFNNPCQNTALLIREVPYLDLKAIIDYIYQGEIKIKESQLTSLQKSIEWLKVTCLITDNFIQTRSPSQGSPSSVTNQSDNNNGKVAKTDSDEVLGQENGPITEKLAQIAKRSLADVKPRSVSTNDHSDSVQLTNGRGINGNDLLASLSKPSPSILYPNLLRSSVASHLLKVVAPSSSSLAPSAAVSASISNNNHRPSSTSHQTISSSSGEGQSGPSVSGRVIFQPHEPFVQLRELLRREPLPSPVAGGGSESGLRLTSSEGEHDEYREEDMGGYLSSEEYEMDLPRTRQKFSESSEVRGDSEDCEIENDLGASGESDRLLLDCSGNDQAEEEEQVIDMRVNNGRRSDEAYAARPSSRISHHGYQTNNQIDHMAAATSLDDSPSGDSLDLDCSEKIRANSYSMIPLSIASTFNSATARAIAASTTLAVASGLLSKSSSTAMNGNLNGGHHHHHISGHHHHSNRNNHHELSKNDNKYDDCPVPLKRGRGRPPRHLRDPSAGPPDHHHQHHHRSNMNETNCKQGYDVHRPPTMIPSSSTSSDLSSSAAGLLLSLKKKRLSQNSATTSSSSTIGHHPTGSSTLSSGQKGRKPKLGPPSSADSSGKNVCPYCPQVYYSNQAMNDHINNVHTGNSRKYTCDLCSKEFSWKISLTKHLRNSHKPDNSMEHELDKPLALV